MPADPHAPRGPAALTPDLLPCPFCGKEPKIVWSVDAGADLCPMTSQVACEWCGCSARAYGSAIKDVAVAEREAIASWNRRAPPSPRPEAEGETEDDDGAPEGWFWSDSTGTAARNPATGRFEFRMCDGRVVLARNDGVNVMGWLAASLLKALEREVDEALRNSAPSAGAGEAERLRAVRVERLVQAARAVSAANHRINERGVDGEARLSDAVEALDAALSALGSEGGPE